MNNHIYSNVYLKNKIIVRYLYCIKAYAIICSIAAHCTLVDNKLAGNDVAMFLSNILTCIGSVGVPIFFIISGYLYNNNKPGSDIIKSKVRAAKSA